MPGAVSGFTRQPASAAPVEAVTQHISAFPLHDEPLVFQTLHIPSSVSRDDTLIDSGATHSVVNSSQHLHKFRPRSTHARLADKSITRVTGCVDLYIRNERGLVQKFSDVLLLPGLHANLISLPTADLNGLFHHGGGGRMQIVTKHDELVLGARLRSKLHKCQCTFVPPPAHAFAVTVDAALVHRWFGHMGLSSLAKMSRGNTIRGLPPASCFEKELRSSKVCAPCAEAKQKRGPFPRSVLGVVAEDDPLVATRPFEKLHIDISGPRAGV